MRENVPVSALRITTAATRINS